MVQQVARLARVLAGDEVGLAQDAQGAHGNVLQIADGGRNEIKGASHVVR